MPPEAGRVHALYLAVVELPPERRGEYLDMVCGDDAELRSEVERLLTASAPTDSPSPPPTLGPPEAARSEFDAGQPTLDGNSGSASAAATATFGTTHRPPRGDEPHAGTVVAGRYLLMSVIGEGGMGTVFLADQSEPVKRQVALKLIKSGMDSAVVLARFEAERQALALMDHPNIARVYDGGTTSSGQPFFVMELVHGVPVTQFCDEHRLPVEARLRLFVAVCLAVQHAHQKGIIHRDLKPGNVLVTEVDGRPTPKVIDFGVAKATEMKLTDESFSDLGIIVGTPSYMSPEQADPASVDIDTRTDVYALGVMLYELLTGGPPFDLRQFRRGAVLEVLRLVREEEPTRPSEKLAKADALPAIATNRRTTPDRLAGLLQRELDWVVMKALEKDRSRRYETAIGLARDIERYLADEVVTARPPSTGYRLRKFVKRHRGQVLAAALVLVALLAGIAGTTLALFEAKRQEQIAREEATAKEAAKQDAEARRAEALWNLDEANRQKRRTEESYRLARATLKNVLEIRGDPRLNTGELEDLQKRFARAEGEFYEKFLQLRGDDDAFQLERAAALAEYSSLSYHQGNMEAALRQIQEAIAIDERLRQARPTDVSPARRASNYTQLGIVQTKLGHMDEAIQAKELARDLYDQDLARDPKDAKKLDRAAISRQNLGVAYRGNGQMPEAVRQLEQALAMLDRIPDASTDDARMLANSRAIILSNLAEFYPRVNRTKDAVAAFQKAVAQFEQLAREEPDDDWHRMNLAGNLNNYGLLLENEGRLDEAVATWQKGIAAYQTLVAKRPTQNQFRHALAMGHDNIGMLELRRRRPDAARPHLEEALQLWTRLHTENPETIEYISDLGCVQRNLGDLYAAISKPDTAVEWYAKAIVTLETSPQQEERGTNSHTWLTDAARKRAELLREAGKFKEAVADWDRVVKLEQGSKAESRLRRAGVLALAGEHARAVEEADFLAKLPGTPGFAHYELARVYALTARDEKLREASTKQTIAQLRAAARARFFADPTSVTRLKEDTCFDLLRTKAEFEKFLKEISGP